MTLPFFQTVCFYLTSVIPVVAIQLETDLEQFLQLMECLLIKGDKTKIKKHTEAEKF